MIFTAEIYFFYCVKGNLTPNGIIVANIKTVKLISKGSWARGLATFILWRFYTPQLFTNVESSPHRVISYPKYSILFPT